MMMMMILYCQTSLIFFSHNSIYVYIQHQQIHLIYTVQRHHTLHLHKYYITSNITYTILLKSSFITYTTPYTLQHIHLLSEADSN